jgi:hypothetical protein
VGLHGGVRLAVHRFKERQAPVKPFRMIAALLLVSHHPTNAQIGVSKSSEPAPHRLLWSSRTTNVYLIELERLQKTQPWVHHAATIIIPVTGSANLQQRDANLLPGGPTEEMPWHRPGARRAQAGPASHILYNIDSFPFIGVEVESQRAQFALLPRFTRAGEQYWLDGTLRLGKHVIKKGDRLPAASCPGISIALTYGLLQAAFNESAFAVEPGQALSLREGESVTNVGRHPFTVLTLCELSSPVQTAQTSYNP